MSRINKWLIIGAVITAIIIASVMFFMKDRGGQGMFGSSTIENDRHFVFEVNWLNKKIQNVKADVIGGPAGNARKVQNDQAPQLKLISFDRKELDSRPFEFDGAKAKVEFPYYKDVKEVVVIKDGNEYYRENIAYLANVCGDNTCQAHESRESCLKDCSSGGMDSFCDGEKDGICDADCVDKTLDEDCAGN